MEKHLFGEEHNREALGIGLLDAHTYWNKKRLLFNIVVGLSGLCSLVVLGGAKLNIVDIFSIILWGITANALYCTGYVLESYIITKTKEANKVKPYRTTLFWLGTVAFVLLNIVCAYSFYTYGTI